MHNVLNKKSNKKIQIKTCSRSLYHSLEEEGEELPHGCLSGACGACVIVIENGEDQLEPKTDIEEKTLDRMIQTKPDLKDKKIRLSCQLKIKGDIDFDLL